MLLDRKRINRWAKWVALFLAIVFAAGFLFMGVGYGGAGFNLSELFTGDNDVPDNPQTPEDKIAAYQAQLTQNPKDVAALLGLATVYQQNEDLLHGGRLPGVGSSRPTPPRKRSICAWPTST